MAKVSKFITVSLATEVMNDDGTMFTYGNSVDVEIPRGAKLGARTVGVAVARAASTSLELLYFSAEASLSARKLRKERDARLRSHAAAVIESVAVDAVAEVDGSTVTDGYPLPTVPEEG